MNIVNKLTLRHLKENKGRTVITAMGICVSVAMITAVFVAISSFMNLFGDICLMAGGHYEAVMTVNSSQLDAIKADDRVARAGVMIESTNNDSYSLSANKSMRYGTGDYLSGDSTCINQMITGEYEGKIPQQDREIAVEKSFIEKNNLNWKIGDTVTLYNGTRYMHSDVNGEYIICGSYQKNEYFVADNAQSYKITAVLSSNPATVTSYSIIRCVDIAKHPIEPGGTVRALVELKNVNYKSLDVLKDIIKANGVEDYNMNKDYLETQFAFDENSTMVVSILPMAAIILAIIIIASVVLIYNAFAMSISERVRYLGMLASVGATKAQKRFSVFYEGMVLGVVGIPVGIIAGIVGIGITLKALGEKIISTGMINGVNNENLEMNIVVDPYVLVAIILVSIFTIFISSVIPALKASKITPIDAIRQNSEIKIKAKRLRSSRLVRLIFGYEGELANKNLKRNGRKARTITASIALSVILFLCCNYFCDGFSKSILTETDIPYQVYAGVDYDKKEQLLDEIKDINGIDNFYCVNNGYYVTPTADEKQDGWKFIDTKFLTQTYKSFFNKSHSMYLNAIDDEDFNRLCQANGIDSKGYYSSRKALLMNNISHTSAGSAVFNDSVVGTSLEDFSYKGLTVGALINYDKDLYMCNLNPKNTISLYVPVSQHKAMVDEFNSSGGEDYSYNYILGIETTQHTQITEKIKDIVFGSDYGECVVIDMAESAQTMNTIAMVIEVLVYGFIALISLITVFNIINTISTGIAMRKKEFAMLKSVGTTPKGFNKMIMLESALYGMKALLFGLPISALLSFAMNRAMSTDAIPFEINWLLYLIVTLVVFVIIGLSMLYSVAKLRNDSIIETLKEEIN